MTGARFLTPLVLGIPAAAAAAQQGEPLSAPPEPLPPILWLAPPPGDTPVVEPPLATLFIPPPPSPDAVALPPEARALLAKAMQSGSADTFAAVAKLARTLYPDGGGQIDALSAENDARTAEKKAADARARADALAAASFIDNWKGEAELGASLATGNSRNLGLYAALKGQRDGLRWRHMLNARADYAKTDDLVTTERVVASYQPQYKFDERLYAFGLGQFEHDRFLGYSQRYTAGPGIGYSVATGPVLRIDLEGGPAVRRTVYYDAQSRWSAAGRGSIDVTWKPKSWITFLSDTALFYERGASNLSSTSSLDSRVFGPLKVRLSYTVTYEGDTPDVNHSANTLSRVSLVYDF